MKSYVLWSKRTLLSVGVIAVIVIGYSLVTEPVIRTTGRSGNAPLEVVAAENFWGSLVSQIGGTHVHVTSLVTDPNADPHEFSSSSATAREVATANYVVVNGAGYDGWADKLVGASQSDTRNVLTVSDLIHKKNGDNPHFWYNPVYVNQVTLKMVQDLIALDPANTSYYQAQYKALQSELTAYQDRITQIKQRFSGVKVAATEDIFDYLAGATGLDLVSPVAFTQAVAEGNDPPSGSIVEFQKQLSSGAVKLLVFNQQTETPLTDSMKQLAADNHIPIVGITETIQPINASFQDWMNSEIGALESALTQ